MEAINWIKDNLKKQKKKKKKQKKGCVLLNFNFKWLSFSFHLFRAGLLKL